MKSRWIACLVLGLASAVRADTLVEGPSVVPIGSLVVLKANAQSEKVGWLVLEPSGLEFRLFGQTFVCAAGCRSGEIVIVCVDWEGQVLEKHLVVVGPGPGPDPDPDPEPDPDPIPPPPPTDFVAKLKAALATVPERSKPAAALIAGNYEDIAAQAESNPAAWDPASMMDVVKTMHASDLAAQQLGDWRKFFGGLAVALSELKLQPGDLQSHVKYFKVIADTLKQAGAQP